MQVPKRKKLKQSILFWLVITHTHKSMRRCVRCVCMSSQTKKHFKNQQRQVRPFILVVWACVAHTHCLDTHTETVSTHVQSMYKKHVYLETVSSFVWFGLVVGHSETRSPPSPPTKGGVVCRWVDVVGWCWFGGCVVSVSQSCLCIWGGCVYPVWIPPPFLNGSGPWLVRQ